MLCDALPLPELLQDADQRAHFTAGVQELLPHRPDRAGVLSASGGGGGIIE